MAQPARQLDTQQVHYLRKRITFANFGTVVDIGKIPAKASVVGGGVHIVQAFNSTGTDLLDIGFRGGSSTDDPNGYATQLTLAAIGYLTLDELGATSNIQQTVDTIVTCSPAQSNADATEGIADVMIMFIPNNDQ